MEYLPKGQFMNRIPHRLLKRKGFTLIELAIVVAIIAILASVGSYVFIKFKTRNRIGEGIRQLYQIKKSVDAWSKECGGYPIRNYGGGFNQLSVLIDRQPPTFPMGLPMTHPAQRMCDAVSLQDYIGSNMQLGTCDLSTDPSCASKKSGSTGAQFGSLFVAHSAGPGYAPMCNANSGATMLGWEYVLLRDATDPVAKRAVPVLCGNFVYEGSTVTVIINGAGIAGNTKVPDGSGMVGPDGMPLPDACVCGAWCEDHVHNETGCCQACTDYMGNRHDGLPDIQIKY
jgi:prepilin-type N-terminal cleavage/methylation domain-containing protein